MATQTKSFMTTFIKNNPLVRMYKFYILDSVVIAKQAGFKQLLKLRGWKLFAFIIAYYLIRDTIIYLIIPYIVARGLTTL